MADGVAQIAAGVDGGLEDMAQELSNEVGVSAYTVQYAAQNYLQLLEEVQEQTNAFKAHAKACRQIRKEIQAQLGAKKRYNYASINKDYEEHAREVSKFLYESGIVEKVYLETFHFQSILNEFLGQKVKMVFVYNGVHGPQLYEIEHGADIHDYLTFSEASRGGGFTGRYKASVVNTDAVKAMLPEVKEDRDQNTQNLDSAYGESIVRYENSSNHVVFWRSNESPTGYRAMSVSSEGDLNEAYAFFILEDQYNYIDGFSGEIEGDIEYFMEIGVADVDNVSGLLQGDIRNSNGYEYAIKSANASTLGLAQIKRMAQEIVKITDPSKIKDYILTKQKQFQKGGRTRNKIIDDITEDISKMIDDYFGKFAK